METCAVVREVGEVRLRSAATDSVVGCIPGWGEPGSVTESIHVGKGLPGGRYLVEPKRT